MNKLIELEKYSTGKNKMTYVMVPSNHPIYFFPLNLEDRAEFIKNKVHEVLTSAGKDAAEATAMIDESTREVILLNNEGVRKAEAGELAEAIELLCQAANRLPNNMQIVGNAALVIALDLERNGANPDKLVKCLKYREALIQKSPDHPKLAQIDGLLKQLKQ